MKIIYTGVGANQHAIIYSDAGVWVATVRAGFEAEVANALAPNANGNETISTNEEK